MGSQNQIGFSILKAKYKWAKPCGLDMETMHFPNIGPRWHASQINNMYIKIR